THARPDGGLAVQLGADHGDWAIEQARTKRRLTLVLTKDRETAIRIRKQVRRSGGAGWVTVAEHLDPGRIPLADHMANLIRIEPNARPLDETEIRRVLVPVRGTARWSDGRTLTKPMPTTMDGWTHFFHGPDGNKVSRDTAIRVPNGLRFIAGPRLQDANGANGWRMDEGIACTAWNYIITDKYKPQLVMVEGRDAFNGALLWQRLEGVERGGSISKKTKPFILDDGRVLRVQDDGKETAKIAAWDARTGRHLRTYQSSLNIRIDQYKGREPQFTYSAGRIIQTDERKVVCFDAETDTVIWSHEHDRGMGLTRPTVAEDLGLVFIGESPGWRKFKDRELRMALFEGRYPGTQLDALLAFDLKTGDLTWRCETPAELRNFDLVERLKPHSKNRPNKAKLHAIAYREGRIFGLYACDANSGNPSVIWAADARAGKTLWVAACGPEGDGTREMFDLFLLDDGTIFTYGHAWARIDQATGRLIAFGSNGGNARCDTGACTVNLVTGGFGNYFDLTSDQLRWTKRDLARGQCGGWGTPGYGMMYYKGSGCGCFFPLRGNLALHHTPPPQPIADAKRLTRGPAFDTPLGAPAADNDWPAYLYNGQRRAWARPAGPPQLKPLWNVKIGEPIPHDVEGAQQDWLNAGIYNGPVTAPVIAGGLAFVANRDRHEVVAVEINSGLIRWRFSTGGRVITTPTWSRGRLVFGARDGQVYCLDAATGQLAWCFLAAPEQRFLLAYGQVESVWPLHGCLPVVENTVVATAGYHGEADGGLWAWGLDLATGNITWSKRLNRPLRAWKTLEPKKDRAGHVVHRVRDEEHPRASINQSNGGYHPTRVRNIDLPQYDHAVVDVGLQSLVAATGEPSERPVENRLVIVGERFPFLDMEFEYRGGPHSSGSIGLQFGDLRFNGHRSDGHRAAHDGKRVLLVEHTRDHKKGPGLFLVDPTRIETDRWKRLSSSKLTPIGHTHKSVGVSADSVVLGGDYAYVAGEGHLMRPWGHSGKEQRPRKRWLKGEAIPGHLEVISLIDGRQ
ncbi:MAG: PQQ-binding-like beta-propeller repeat protein, partial [Verrucomicrobiota bacterium]